MLDRLGRQIRIGELVTIQNHPELQLKVNWEVKGFIDHGVAIEAILCNFISGDIVFVSIMDLDKEFN